MRLSLLLLLAACAPTAPTDEVDDTDVVPDLAAPGPHPVALHRLRLTDAARERTLHALAWVPAADGEAETTIPVTDLAPDEAAAAALSAALPSAHDPGTLRTTSAAWEGDPTSGPWPVVALSHCLDCTAFSLASTARHLASHGIAAVALDHTGGTFYDAEDAAPLGNAFLDVRAADVSFLLDVLLDPTDETVPEVLRGRFDAGAVGVAGHSFGALTTGRVLATDDRPRAGAGLAAPLQNPLFPGTSLAAIEVPLLMVVATEDGSITELGNEGIRADFAAANPPVRKLELVDAGHWAVSTICGLQPRFGAGCTEPAVRQTDGSAFTWAPVDEVRAATAAWVTAFFLETLADDAGATAWMAAQDDPAVGVAHREPATAP